MHPVEILKELIATVDQMLESNFSTESADRYERIREKAVRYIHDDTILTEAFHAMGDDD